MSKCNVHNVDVHFGDCDPAGIVFLPNFSRWMDEASLAFFKACGVPPWRELARTRGIVGTPLLETGYPQSYPCLPHLSNSRSNAAASDCPYVSRSIKAEFVLDALEQALHERKSRKVDALIPHSDRGQYCSICYGALGRGQHRAFGGQRAQHLQKRDCRSDQRFSWPI